MYVITHSSLALTYNRDGISSVVTYDPLCLYAFGMEHSIINQMGVIPTFLLLIITFGH